MPVVYVNIGSNIGCRENNIGKALDCIGDLFGYYCVSSIVESEPWGYDSSHRFLNIGVAFKSEMEPEKILEELKRIEQMLGSRSHRDLSGKYCDREVDIDIMAIDRQVYHSDSLQVPHPHLKERIFFLIPLFQLEPDWHHPECKATIEVLINNLGIDKIS